MQIPRFASLGALLAALLLPTTALADAISGPPACPPGAHGRSSHSGQWCEPWVCTSDEQCGPAATCRPWRVCTRQSDVQPGGLRPEPAPVERMAMVVGTCEPGAKCRGDEEPAPQLVGTLVPGAPECREAQHCVSKALPALPPVGTPGTAPPTGTAPTGTPSTPAPQATGAPAGPPPGCGCTQAPGPTGAFGLVVALMCVRRRRAC